MSIRDNTEERLARIEGGDPAVFTRVYRAEALAAASAADARRAIGITLGPLDGVIVSIKDLFDVAGETTTAGSTFLRREPPASRDALVVSRLRRAGAIIIGKTNMSEFAFSAVGLNPHYGTPGNAADATRVPGGSSSGAGVSVAQGTSDISIGSDTGGSVRVPASLNGVVGFKPTARRIPLNGAFPLSYALDSIGPLARTVADCAAADAVMAGEEFAAPRPIPLAGLRIGVPRGRLFEGTESIVAEGFETAIGQLSKAGAGVIDCSIEEYLTAMVEASAGWSIANVEAAAVHADWFETFRSVVDPRVYQRIAIGRNVPAPSYLRTMRKRTELMGGLDRAMAAYDLLALPATATTAPSIAPLLADDEAFARVNMLMLRNTSFGNFFDLTGISLPMPDLARPAGLMLLARGGHDQRLLQIAASVEGLLGD